MKKSTCPANPRLNRVGGEAVIDGVMMKAGTACSTAVRSPKGNIRILKREFISARTKHNFLNIPILRGLVNFIETMKLSFGVLNDSAEVFMEEEQESKTDTWMKKHLGFSLTDMVSFLASLLGVVLALALFLYLPNLASQGIEWLIKTPLGPWKAVTSGVMKLVIFVVYIWLVSLMPDIRRTFEYHGAEHKSIACFEAGADLSPENAKQYSRFHPRCGTSFMFVMILLGVILSLVARLILETGFGINFATLTLQATGHNLESLIYAGIGLVLLPLIVGIGYEFLMYAGKHCDNLLVRILSAPGLWMQRLTTREPSLDQLEVAIAALKHAMPDEFPDMDRAAYESKEGYAPLTAETPETDHDSR